MTREDFYEKYGEVTVKFSYYYKFTFTYTAILPDGSKLSCDIGGDSDDIYKTSVSFDDEHTIIDLEPFAGRVYKGKDLVEEFYDY